MSNIVKTLFGFSVAFFLFSNVTLLCGYLASHGYPVSRDAVNAMSLLSAIIVFSSIALIGLLGLAIPFGTIKGNGVVLVSLRRIFIVIIVWGTLALPIMGICEEIYYRYAPLPFLRLINSPLFLYLPVGIGLISGFVLWIAKRKDAWFPFCGMLLCAYSFCVSHWICLAISYAA